MEGRQATARTPFSAWHRRFVDFKYQYQEEREAGSACFSGQAEIHSSNKHHETPTERCAVQSLGYRGNRMWSCSQEADSLIGGKDTRTENNDTACVVQGGEQVQDDVHQRSWGSMGGSWKRKGLSEPSGGEEKREVRRRALQVEGPGDPGTENRLDMERMPSNLAMLCHRVQGERGHRMAKGLRDHGPPLKGYNQGL